MAKSNLSPKIHLNKDNFESLLQERVNNEISKYVINTNEIDESMRYALSNPGKRVRPLLAYLVGDVLNLDLNKIDGTASAIEIIHTYSLVHDDLPCMDNDKLRRGKPSTHIKFGESTAVLAGNSLLTLAFEIITDKKYKVKHATKVILLKKLAECAGHTGIAGGQFLDLSYEKRKVGSSKIMNMQKKKTGKLFEFCCLAPSIVSGKNNKIKREMRTIGEELGFLFQIADDLLDVKGSKKNVGKPIRKDKKKGKSTLIKLFGYRKTLEFAFRRKKMIISKLKKYGTRSNKLIKITDFILDRSY